MRKVVRRENFGVGVPQERCEVWGVSCETLASQEETPVAKSQVPAPRSRVLGSGFQRPRSEVPSLRSQVSSFRF